MLPNYTLAAKEPENIVEQLTICVRKLQIENDSMKKQSPSNIKFMEVCA
jgi:hypothetical protein